jgi:trans-2,3-dihydro-3-hydroxyanthranilate isomerase
MNRYPFVIADVFTNTRFGGNQLAVFTNGAGLDSETMQNIAREMNYSETTFVLAPETGSDFRVRIFTPARELPFAGHPIVGTSYVVVSEGLKPATSPHTEVTLEVGVGPIPVEVTGEGATMTQPLPVIKESIHDFTALASALSLPATAFERTRLPAQAIYNGITTVIAPVDSMESMKRVKVDIGKLEEFVERYGAETVLVFTRDTVHKSSTVHCRVFAPGAGVVEDAATGSANGPLGYYLVKQGLVEVPSQSRPANIVSEQGFEMNRPSILNIEVQVDPGDAEITRVRVGGGVVVTGKGEIFV